MTPTGAAYAFLDAASRGDRGAMLSLFADDAVVDEPMNGVQRGIDAISRAIASWPRFRNQRIASVTEDGPTVRMRCTLDADGYGVVDAAFKFTMRGDKIGRLDVWA